MCGIVDIRGIIRGQSSIKVKGFDIAGIVLGFIFIIAIIYLQMTNILDKVNGEGQPL